MDRRHYTITAINKLLLLTLFIAIGLILFMLESFLPQPIPGGKIGLSQLVTLLVLFWFGWIEALIVVIFRVFISSLILGTLFNPVFLLGFFGALASLLLMSIAHHKIKKFSIVGISILGAAAHNGMQLLLAYWLFIQRPEIFWLVPYFIWVSLFSGLLIGLAAHYIFQKFGMNMIF